MNGRRLPLNIHHCGIWPVITWDQMGTETGSHANFTIWICLGNMIGVIVGWGLPAGMLGAGKTWLEHKAQRAQVSTQTQTWNSGNNSNKRNIMFTWFNWVFRNPKIFHIIVYNFKVVYNVYYIMSSLLFSRVRKTYVNENWGAIKRNANSKTIERSTYAGFLALLETRMT